MKLKNKMDVENFKSVIDKCEHNVYIKSHCGDVFNLKSVMSQFVAIGKLVSEHGDELEIFADSKADEMLLIEFLIKLDK